MAVSIFFPGCKNCLHVSTDYLPSDPKAPLVVSEAATEDVDELRDEARILCRRCGQIIGRPEDRIAVNGAHQHAFANPHGIIFEIACFQAVTGCGTVGEASAEFTWFPGYSWRIIICGNCLTHLGWLFSADGGHHFFGLVLDYIVSIE